MIRIEHLTYTYPAAERPALQDVGFELQAGQGLLLTGTSGSGKSTLLWSMNGLVPHFYGGRFAGRVRVAGLDTRESLPPAMAAKVGTVFQEPTFRFITSTAGDEIAFGLELAGLPTGDIRRRVQETLERLDIGDLRDRPLDRLSGGEQQRVAIAAALARQPQVLLLDEPTSQLDVFGAATLIDWLADLRREMGLTTLISEHRLGRLVETVDRVAYLEPEGRLAGWGEPRVVLASMPFGLPEMEAARRLGVSMDPGPAGLLMLRRHLRQESRPGGTEPEGEMRLQGLGLRLGYNGQVAVRGVDLHVGAGEILAVLGRNGSGKSSLLRGLMGLEQLQAGEVWLDRRRIDHLSPVERARDLAFVPQWPAALLFAESVRAELDLTLTNHGLLGDPPVPPAELLEQLQLTQVAERSPRDLSAGERQRAALAAVMVAGPRLLLLDEPTLGVDPLAQRNLARLLSEWRRQGKAIVLATHDIEFAARLANRVLLLEAGQVVDQGPTAETLFRHPELQTALQRLTRRPWPASPADIPAGDGA
ncbi:MAG: ATP-binding cassette domain-containing protein [Anaerolineales bacterium]|nr:ATP-binding cassette domain-containing protein [Anaerolineales bacterium]